MIGIEGWNPQAQVDFLQSLAFSEVPSDVYTAACTENGAVGYGPVEAAVLYAFVTQWQPKKIVQVGAGVSTSVILRAAREQGSNIAITCVDPFPNDYLHKLADDGDVRLLAQPAQIVDMQELVTCESGDLLFVDSTHTVQPGSDVNRLVLEVLPQLNTGVFVHFHDITWPYDYPRDLLADRFFFWEESTLLHAFLVGNARYVVRACLSLLHYEAPEGIRAVIPTYQPERNDDGLALHTGAHASPESHFPSAVYLEVVDI